MERRPRSAQKRRAHVTASDDNQSDSGSNVSDEGWTLSSDSSRTPRSDTSSQVDTQSHGSSESSDCVLAPPLEQTRFDSWEELHVYLDEYMQQTYQSFRVRTNSKVAERNNKIKAAGSKTPAIPEEWGYYNKTLVCKHGGTFKSRGQGKRPRQETRRIKCGAQLDLDGFAWAPRFL
ncbi:hypothetical protein PInf_016316 [Phytophthora infestans]|nr:hypothetical protein PInf_016316 [Phytophthora infestans]